MELFMYCPACAVKLTGKRSEIRRDLSFNCDECGVLVLFKGRQGLSRFLDVRRGQAVFYRWVICVACNIAVNQDRLIHDPNCPGCGYELSHGLDGSEGFSDSEINKWKGASHEV